jgi:hypothetical protein
MGKPAWIGKWEGGRVKEAPLGPQWVIERMVNGRRFSTTLRVTDERSALGELYIFEKDPAGYLATPDEKPRGLAPKADDATIAAYLSYLQARKLNPAYIADCKAYVMKWKAALRGRPVDQLPLADLRRIARTSGAERKMVTALKSFTKFLRTEGVLDHSADPTLALASVPGRAEQSVRVKGYSIAEIEAAYRACSSQAVRDVLVIRIKTGLHGTEIERIAHNGTQGRIEAVEGKEPIAGVFVVIHKNGHKHQLCVDAQTLAAGLRLQARGRAPAKSTCQGVLASAGHPMRLGELRHSFVNLARSKGSRAVEFEGDGIPAATVARMAGHSLQTANLFYANLPRPLALLPIALQHPDDPAAQGGLVAPAR